MRKLISLAIVTVIAVSVAAGQTKVTKESVPGIRNLAKLEMTVACAGAITPESIAEIKKMGYASVMNLRLASEPGADVEAAAAAAKTAGINYIHIPVDSAQPSRTAIDDFLKAVRDPRNNPAFIHCASANRAAALWYVKRVLVDKWDSERAMEEASALGLTSQPLKNFVTEYVKTQRK
jgi:uncharacterized protein (TIGR01244 family)